jgi:hypothetical protein
VGFVFAQIIVTLLLVGLLSRRSPGLLPGTRVLRATAD